MRGAESAKETDIDAEQSRVRPWPTRRTRLRRRPPLPPTVMARQTVMGAWCANCCNNAALTARFSPSESGPSTPPPQSPSSPPEEMEPAPSEDKVAQAEKIKEQGNAAFKNKQYKEAIDLYSKAIGASPASRTPLIAHMHAHLQSSTPRSRPT